MRKGKMIGKIFGKAMVLVLIAVVVGGLPTTNNELAVSAAGSHLIYTVYATREGSVGGTTANGHVIVAHDHFVALPSTKVLCSNGGHEYEVKVTYNGKSVIAPVWDVGPWNTKDNYWDPPSQREMWEDLPRGKSEAQAANQDGYNGGFDETNYLVKVSTSSDEFSVGDRVRPTVNGLKVRSTAGGVEIGSVLTSDQGTVIGGPQKAILNGIYYRWWNITWDKGLSGWSAQKRYVSNPAGIDLADGTFWDDLGMTDNDWVTVEFLWTTAEDAIPPTVDAFDVTPGSVTLGNAFTISYSVSDTGGSGLGWVQLWRKYETASWEQVDSTTLSGVGNGPYSSSFSDTPLAVGTYWYGIHVGDDAGNWITEGGSGFSPIEVEVIQANSQPQLSNGYVDPSNGTPSTNFYYYVTYFDPDGDSPSVKQVYIDGIAYTMTWYSGLNSHITYRYGPKNLSAGGTHYYFFYFEDGKGGTRRLPSGIDMYLGPSVTPETYPPQVTTEGASSITTSSAALTGNLDSTGGLDCQVWFEYGTSTSYGSSTSKLSKSSTGPFSAIISSLSPDTTYHFRACASNSKGTSYGSDMTFKTEPAAQVVTFPDPNLEAAIREAIGKPTGDIYQSDLEGLIELDASIREISNLGGLEYCTSLEELYLFGNEISDISPISGLDNFRLLNLVANRGISDISPLSNLTSLELLYLSVNDISDIGAVSGLVNLRDLELYGNDVRDISPISGLVNLRELDLSGNPISDISPISELVNLRLLSLEVTHQLDNLSAVSDLTSLEQLYLSGNEISDIAPISGLVNLRELTLGSNLVSDISPISGLLNLRYLNLMGNQVSDVSVLSELTELRTLYLDDNQITSIASLSNLTKLGKDAPFLWREGIPICLGLQDNEVSDIQPLVQNAGLGEGDGIDLRGNPLSVDSLNVYVPQLEARGVNVLYDYPRTWYVDDDLADYPAADFTKIQEAVDAASSGDTIIVYPGTYTENVDVNKEHLTIQSESGAEVTIVQAADPNDHVFDIRAASATIKGFMAEGATGTWAAGICLSADCCHISENTCRNNGIGGIWVRYSSGNSLENNMCFENGFPGIFLYYSSGNTVENNTCSNNVNDGIYLQASSGNHLGKNTCFGSSYGISLWSSSENTVEDNTCSENVYAGISLSDSSGNTLESNTCVESNNGILLTGSSENTLVNNNASNNNDRGINLYSSCSANIIENNSCSSNMYCGIQLADSCTNNIVEGNTCNYNGVRGIELVQESDNNIVRGNTCSYNDETGIIVAFSLGNTFERNNCVGNHQWGIYSANSDGRSYLNNISGNGDNVFAYDSAIVWNSPEQITYTYSGKTYTNYLGNYWSDYTGSDADGDGIGETTYPIDSDADNYPLMEPFENYVIGTPTPLAKTLPVPYYYQGATDWCVPTSMSMILKYYGQNIHSWDIAKEWDWGREIEWWKFWTPLCTTVSGYFNDRDLTTETYYCSWPIHYDDIFDNIKHWVDSDMPVFLAMSEISHAVVIVGYEIDDGTKKIYISDPSGTLINDNMHLAKPYPLIAVESNWNDVTPYIGWGSYLIAVDGEPQPPKGTIDIQDYGVYFCTADKPNFPQVYSWLYGHGNGLIWEHFLLHPLALNSRDIFKFDKAIVNNTPGSQTYVLEVRFAGAAGSVVSRWNVSVGGRGYKGDITEAIPLQQLLSYPGEYTITLSLWNASLSEKFDELTFPSINYSSLIEFYLCSAADLYITDPMARHVGVDSSTGQIVNEIPDAIYSGPGSEPQVIAIPDPLDGNYMVEVIGTAQGNYSLTTQFVTLPETMAFVATDIPTAPGAVHQYIIDWEALSEGDEGVTVQIDSDGDGVFADTFTSDEELTQDEFMHETIPQLLKEDAISRLDTIEPGKRAAQRLIDNSIQSINKSLSNRLWADDSHLNSRMMAGTLVFDMEKAAVLNLKAAEKIEPTVEDEIEAVIDKLTKADKLLCIIAINDAKSVEVKNPWKKKIVDREIAKAEEQLDKACGYLEKDMPAWAITYFKLSWVYAQGAINVAQAKLPSRW